MAAPLRVLKPVLFALCLLPLASLAYAAASGGLGANPIEALNRGLGEWALRLLLATLAISPARRLTGLKQLIRLRRMLGLFAFCYALLHLLSYVILDQFFDWSAIVEDLIKRPYITFGMLAFVLLVPLAITSTRRWQQRLGRRWQRLHRLIYPAAALAVLHLWLLTKADWLAPGIYLVLLVTLLLFRLPFPRHNT